MLEFAYLYEIQTKYRLSNLGVFQLSYIARLWFSKGLCRLPNYYGLGLSGTCAYALFDSLTFICSSVVQASM